MKKEKYVLVNIYRSPCGKINLFLEKLNDILDKLFKIYKNIILTGDLNINTETENTNHRKLLDIIKMYNLQSVIKSPTRVTHHTTTTIDHIITNLHESRFSCEVINSLLSDHYAQHINIHMNITEQKMYSQFRDTRENNLITLYTLLKSENWSGVLQELDVDKQLDLFYSIFMSHYNAACPLVTRKVKRPKNKWFDKNLLTLKTTLKYYYDRYKQTKLTTDRNNYLHQKKIYRDEIKAAKKSYITNTILNSQNISKSLWNIINNETERGKLPKNTHKFNTIKSKDGKTLTHPSDICNEFNTTLLENVTNLINAKVKHTTQHNTYTHIQQTVNSLYLPEITQHDLSKIVNQLKISKATSADGLSTFILKKCFPYLCVPLLSILNSAIKDGTFPTSLKDSVVIPIHKKGKADVIDNYRPITLVSVISKVLEKHIAKHLTAFLDKHKILNVHQYGFRKKHSTINAITHLIENIIDNIDNNVKTNSLFLDLSKAFDCIDHTILLDKLYRYGVRGIPQALLKSYLSNRTQQIRITHLEGNMIKQYTSEKLNIQYGVPQGSVLGPLLFIIYVNDIPTLSNGKAILFADDTSIINQGTTTENLELTTYINTEQITDYFESNNLFINPAKTNYILFETHQRKQTSNITVTIKEQEIKEVLETNFLGLKLDKHLSWKPHIDKVCKKVSSNIFILKHMSQSLEVNILKTIYYALIHPHLSYGLIVWGHCAKEHMQRIFRLQKYAIRTIMKLKKTVSCRQSFKNLNILTVYSMYIMDTIIHTKHRLSLQTNTDIHSHDTRNKDKYHMQQHNLKLYDSKPSMAGCIFFNKLPPHIRHKPSDSTFRQSLKNLLITKCYYSIDEFLEDNLT